tara:strand:+ start:109 stop:444 length:336 start_codon:yes stop_codon:yes gene_type:complete
MKECDLATSEDVEGVVMVKRMGSMELPASSSKDMLVEGDLSMQRRQELLNSCEGCCPDGGQSEEFCCGCGVHEKLKQEGWNGDVEEEDVEEEDVEEEDVEEEDTEGRSWLT